MSHYCDCCDTDLDWLQGHLNIGGVYPLQAPTLEDAQAGVALLEEWEREADEDNEYPLPDPAELLDLMREDWRQGLFYQALPR